MGVDGLRQPTPATNGCFIQHPIFLGKLYLGFPAMLVSIIGARIARYSLLVHRVSRKKTVVGARQIITHLTDLVKVEISWNLLFRTLHATL